MFAPSRMEQNDFTICISCGGSYYATANSPIGLNKAQ